MRTPARTKGLRRQVARTASVPAPVGGWNRRDSIAQMREIDAVKLENWFPLASELRIRKGYSNHATGLPGQVESLMSHDSKSGTTKLFAASSTGIYNVTSAGAVGAADISGLANARWQHIQFATPSGTYLVICNGADDVRTYDGSSWATPAITGVTLSELIHVNAFKNRLWFVQKDTMKVWYLPVQSIAGAASSIDFSSLFTRGGYLMAMGTWTLDAGTGMDDHAVFVTSEGEIAIYKGTDPASAATWALVGVWSIGEPIGRRCFVKFGGDLLLITKDGLIPMSRGLLSTQANKSAALTDKIQQAMSEATSLYGSNFGWQVMDWPTEQMLILNVPVSVGSQEQYVMNTITGSWCKFTGWDANCWESFNEHIYFGGNQVVCKAWDTFQDDATNVMATALPAFSNFGNNSQLKRWTMVRPVISTDGNPGLVIGLNVDYDTASPAGNPTFSSSVYGLWDSALWDAGIWGGGLTIKRDWQTVTGVGYAASLQMKVSNAVSDIRWISSEYVLEAGGVI